MSATPAQLTPCRAAKLWTADGRRGDLGTLLINGLAEANHAVSVLRARIETEAEPLAVLVREALGVLAQRQVLGSKPKTR